MVVPDEGRPGVHEHEGALGQVAPPRTVEPAGPMARLPPLLVEQPVELGREESRRAEALGDEAAELRVGGSAALGAGTVAGSEGNGLVEEEERCVVPRLPLGGPAVPEREAAGDPGPRLVVAHDVSSATPLVQSSAVAHPGTPPWRGDDLAEGADPVAGRCADRSPGSLEHLKEDVDGVALLQVVGAHLLLHRQDVGPLVESGNTDVVPDGRWSGAVDVHRTRTDPNPRGGRGRSRTSVDATSGSVTKNQPPAPSSATAPR